MALINEELQTVEQMLAGARSRLDGVMAETKVRETYLENLQPEITRLETAKVYLTDQTTAMQGKVDLATAQLADVIGQTAKLTQENKDLTAKNAQITADSAQKQAEITTQTEQLKTQQTALDNQKTVLNNQKVALEADKLAHSTYTANIVKAINGTGTAGSI